MTRLLAFAALAAAFGLAAWAWTGFSRARVRSASALALRSDVLDDARRLDALRRRSGAVSLGQRPEPGLIEQLRSALAEAGVPRESLASLQPGSEVGVPASGLHAAPGARYLRQTAVASLQPLRLHELGDFLDVWRRRVNGWNVDAIQLAPLRTDDRSDPFPPLRVTLTLGAVYLQTGPSEPAHQDARP